MTADELTDRIRAADAGTAIDVDAVIARLNGMLRADVYAVICGCGDLVAVRPGLTKFDLLQRVRNRLTARERAILRNSC